MRKIAVVTGTRAEYGLLRNTLLEIKKDKSLKLYLIVTGTHLSETYGYTKNEIVNDGFEIYQEIPILSESCSRSKMSKEMGLLMSSLSQTFENIEPDFLLILGDRYEIFASASVAMTMNIPIAHISGGEITEGAIDDQIRHAITKMAHLHFPGNEVYANNIIRMGEEDWRVFNVGDPGIENIKLTQFLNKEQLSIELGVEVDKNTILVTYHPVTLEIKSLEYQIDNLIQALSYLNYKVIITYPNSDYGSDLIIKKINNFASRNNNVYLFKNIGTIKYLSIMKLCGAVVGNSSSAIVEAPYLKIPVVNIGNRQKGRLMAQNIISCEYNSLSNDFSIVAKSTTSLYGDGNTSKEICKVIKNISLGSHLLKKKLKWS
jgi:GDP/UDP-N,N'-diacetylbacillosamine 2-epimerase (hydrolysing)